MNSYTTEVLVLLYGTSRIKNDIERYVFLVLYNILSLYKIVQRGVVRILAFSEFACG